MNATFGLKEGVPNLWNRFTRKKKISKSVEWVFWLGCKRVVKHLYQLSNIGIIAAGHCRVVLPDSLKWPKT